MIFGLSVDGLNRYLKIETINKKAVSSRKRLGPICSADLTVVPFAGITQIRFQGYNLRLISATPTR
jgi:hypothetical protein